MQTLADKQPAIDQHSRQAAEFAERYKLAEKDPYRDCFLYSRKRLDAVLGKYLPSSGSGLRLLDVGCGTGNQMERLKAVGFEVAGIDGSPEMLAHARAINPKAEIHQADVESIPFPDATFDYVLCIEVLRYLRDPRPCMKEIARVLKPGGVCLITAAPRFNLNGYWLINRIANILPVKSLVRLKQYFTTSPRMRHDLRDSGFASVEIHGVYFGPINWIQRLSPRLLPRVLRAWEPCDAAIADRWLLRDLSNMYLACAKK